MSLLPVFGLALAGLIAWIAADCLRPGAGSRAAGPARP
jgi:hypothetical protein